MNKLKELIKEVKEFQNNPILHNKSEWAWFDGVKQLAEAINETENMDLVIDEDKKDWQELKELLGGEE